MERKEKEKKKSSVSMDAKSRFDSNKGREKVEHEVCRILPLINFFFFFFALELDALSLIFTTSVEKVIIFTEGTWE